MAALLTVERHNTEKVGILIAECRRMGIEVLPPNVNVSGHNFGIEQLPQDRPAPHRAAIFPFPVPERTAIRMGMDAIKNVGEGPIDAILNARGDRAFASLAEFADRVDLRQVNRRGLECLIKVGALDDFGERGQLLAGIDRIMAASEVTHIAREVGQLTLFGGADEDGAEELLASLPAGTKANPKETLDWEKELVGVYVSSHPLQRMTVDLMNVITHASVEVTEEVAGRGVVVAGIVTDVRQITTKKGETMAFVRLEDLQGSIDVTVFPRLYADEKTFFVPEKIIIVAGKADVRNGRVSVVAETVRDYVEGMKVIEDTSSVAYRFRNGAAGVSARPQIKERPTVQSYATPTRTYAPPPALGGDDDEEEAYSDDANPFATEEPAWMDAGEMGRGGDRGTGSQGDGESEGVPVEPSGPGSRSEPQMPQKPVSAQPAPAHRSSASVLQVPAPAQAAAPPKPGASASSRPQAPAGSPAIPAGESAVTPSVAAGAAPNPQSAAQNPRSVKLAFRRSASLDADRKRLAEIVDVLSKYQGEDRFEITVVANGLARWQLDFPNNRTRVCKELQAELTQRLGPGGWKVEG
jgi:DNA polymerase III subunit alpha